jgi:hypothetical protein
MDKDPPYLEAVQNPLEDIALGRGVCYRGMYAPEALNGANLLEIQGRSGAGKRPGCRLASGRLTVHRAPLMAGTEIRRPSARRHLPYLATAAATVRSQ